MQVGHGAVPTAVVKNFATGSLEKTDNPLILLLMEMVSFCVLGPNDEILYTHDGSFKICYKSR